jgi:hypothetical protein
MIERQKQVPNEGRKISASAIDESADECAGVIDWSDKMMPN